MHGRAIEQGCGIIHVGDGRHPHQGLAQEGLAGGRQGLGLDQEADEGSELGWETHEFS